MPDLIKVIAELEELRSYLRSIGNNVTADIADDALLLLKEQEPVKPVNEECYMYPRCGNCKAWLLRSDNFCSECGKKVKWE